MESDATRFRPGKPACRSIAEAFGRSWPLRVAAIDLSTVRFLLKKKATNGNVPQYVNGAKRRGTNTVQNDELLLSKGDNTAGRLKMARLPDISKPADENSSALTSEISVAEELTKKEKDFDDKFKAKLEEAEIDFKGKLDLGYDESGNIVVKNSDLNDDEKSSIESMFAKGSELAQDYKELTNLRDMVSKIDVASSQESSYFSRENQNESLLSLMSGSKISDAINTASKYASHSTMSTNLAMIR